jgi:glycosyltransferase involved in cell wall biosynthesis
MKDIIIVAHFTRGTIEGRFNYLAKLIANKEFNIELITSDFSHAKKQRKERSFEGEPTPNYKITLIKESGYPKNVCLRRFYSHYIMSKNLEKYLSNREKPDMIYCAVPSLDVAYVTAKYANKHKIRFIIDIQDLWPEAFRMVFNIPVISHLIFAPMKRKADYIYQSADEIIAVSETYVKRALEVNRKCTTGLAVYLGIILENFDVYKSRKPILDKPYNEFWIAYIGTLGHSYDIPTVIDSLKILKDKSISNIKFIVMGNGPLKDKFEKYAKEKEIGFVFTGALNYAYMVSLLCRCDCVVNPIKSKSAATIINKHADYAASGLPVLNTQECDEYRQLINKYKMGFNCINSDAVDLADKINKLYEDTDLRMEMGLNSRRCAEDLFSRSTTYHKILNIF